MKKKEDKKLYILIRYYLLLMLALFSLPLIYKVLTPLTVYLSGFLLSVYYTISITNNILSNNVLQVNIVRACIAGSAYLLLIILNFSVPMETRRRVKSLIFSCSALFILNVIRIVILTTMYFEGFPYFDTTHKLFWLFLSTFFVVGIWFLTVKIFSITEIPFYSDIRSLMDR